MRAPSGSKGSIVPKSSNNVWRIGKNDIGEEVVESLKVDSLSLTRSLLDKINVQMDSKTKFFKVRAVNFPGFGKVCPAKTSEGAKCGIAKSLSILARTSYNSEHIPNRLDSMYSMVDLRDFSDTLNNDYCKFEIFFSDEKSTVRLENVFISETFVNLFLQRNKHFNSNDIELIDNGYYFYDLVSKQRSGIGSRQRSDSCGDSH